MAYYIVYKQTGKAEEQVGVYGKELLAIDEARKIDSQLMPWEKVEVRKLENAIIENVPYKTYIAERKSKTIIEEVKGMSLNDALEWAVGEIAEYEKDDEISQKYISDWYDVIDEDGNSYLYEEE